MPTLAERILGMLSQHDGLTDREITNRLLGPEKSQVSVNQACHSLEQRGLLSRRMRGDGRKGNFMVDKRGFAPTLASRSGEEGDAFQQTSPSSEDRIKRHLDVWLRSKGWSTRIAWGREQGIDVLATRGDERWVLEVKGEGTRSAMRVNYFLGALAELLQRMDDPAAKYSVVFPDMQQYRRLWGRLPSLAKSRVDITALFVDASGRISE